MSTRRTDTPSPPGNLVYMLEMWKNERLEVALTIAPLQRGV